jgi:hypothetical protein
MVTAAGMRKLALAMPGVEEKSHFEQPDFRVKNKIFAGLSRDGAEGTLKLTPELQAAAMDSREEAFRPAAGAWGRSGWTHVRLARVDAALLKELLYEAWRLKAPKRLVLEHAAAAAPAPPGPPPKRRRRATHS